MDCNIYGNAKVRTSSRFGGGGRVARETVASVWEVLRLRRWWDSPLRIEVGRESGPGNMDLGRDEMGPRVEEDTPCALRMHHVLVLV